jgi:Protein of unknown function (DUF1580)
VIDIDKQSLVLLSKAGECLPGKPHPSTISRWASRGIRGVRLETCLVGGRRYTSREALQRFIAAATFAGGRKHALQKSHANVPHVEPNTLT